MSKRRCGSVALVGRPNAGKSTLANQLIGQKIAIVSDKPQTTRNRPVGIRTRGESQFIFVDTPGIHKPGYRLNERMMQLVLEALKDVDVVVHLVDLAQNYGKGESYAVDLVRRFKKRAILALNKVDLVNKGRILPVLEFYDQFSVYEEMVPVSALRGENLEALLDCIEKRLPEGEFRYPSEEITDQNERFIVAEIIREKVLLHTRRELPYATAVKVDLFDESRRKAGFVRIAASIVVDKGGQKKIVIGRGGRMIKVIGMEARKEIEEFLQVAKIYLDLNVRVVSEWRNAAHLLDELGVR
ncbi:MAG: GTPase Era [Acidobacteriota bacterium]